MPNVPNPVVGTRTYFAGSTIALPVGSGAGLVIVAVNDFGFPLSTPTISDYTMIARITDARGSDETAMSVFAKSTNSLGGEGTTVTVDVIGASSFVGEAYWFPGCELDGSFTTNSTACTSVANPFSSQIVVPNHVVTVDGALSLLVCGAWDFNVWRAVSSGGTQTAPSGFTTPNPGETTEYSYYYRGSLSIGNVGGTFGNTTDLRYCVIQVVIRTIDQANALMFGMEF